MKYSYIFIFSLTLNLPSITFAYDSADQLHTLFTSPGTRLQLDYMRNSGAFNKQAQQNSDFIVLQPANVNMQGIVLRKKHKPVIFANGSNTLKSPIIDNEILIKSGNIKAQSLTIPLNVRQKSLKLMPGQQWSESEGKVSENFQVIPAKQNAVDVVEKMTSKLVN